ncbi:LysR family transcriptional regulator [Rhodococcus opacus]|uniref:LysR family transcriptional regulator n=1 Tax=Rhodococcus opacus TaxID=37919 RepID=UPI00211EB096|nr:LysR family transcriptional regulator [Rhodococcus opacus]
MTVTHRETSVFNRHRSARQSREPLTGALGLTDALADDLRLFAEVVRRGRLTEAVNHLQINHATVSRHITPVSSKPWRVRPHRGRLDSDGRRVCAYREREDREPYWMSFPRDLVRLARVPMMAECMSLSRMVESHPGLFAAR